jgi:hypothetical protein
MSLRAVLLIGLILGSAYSVFGNEYEVTVNTSSIVGTVGSLDFQFNPGPFMTQAADLQISHFLSNGAGLGGSPFLTGDVSGDLSGAVTFDNGSGFNDYFEGFTYGTTLSFDVNLYGPAVTSPDQTSMSGSAFAFSMFSDGAGTVPTLTTDTADGFAFTAGINLDGTVTVTNYSAQTSVQALPEPNGVAEAALGAVLFCAWLSLRRIKGLVSFFRAQVPRR